MIQTANRFLLKSFSDSFRQLPPYNRFMEQVRQSNMNNDAMLTIAGPYYRRLACHPMWTLRERDAEARRNHRA